MPLKEPPFGTATVCLNHVHLVAIPREEESLAQAVGRTPLSLHSQGQGGRERPRDGRGWFGEEKEKR